MQLIITTAVTFTDIIAVLWQAGAARAVFYMPSGDTLLAKLNFIHC